MKYISVNEVIRLQEKLISRYGGSYGVREYNLLESSVESVFQTYDGVELYPTVLDKVIQVSYSLIENHSFIDGNKRIGVMVLLYLLELNGISHSLTNKDVIDIGLSIASGKMSKEDFKIFIKNKIIND